MVELHALLGWLCMSSVAAVQEERALAFRLLADLGARDVEELVDIEDGRVVAINARGKELKGNIPAELGNLTSLQFLELSGNQLTGAIPTESGNLAKLSYLFLGDNKLTGQIPRELGSLISLITLALNGNKLTGPIPRTIGPS